MKAIQKLYILFITVLVTLNSCKLDEVIRDTATPATVNSESDVTAVIIGMYGRFNDSGMFKFLGHNMITLPADDIYSTAGSEYAAYAQRTLTSATTNPMWANFYATIKDANNLIDVLDKMEFRDRKSVV